MTFDELMREMDKVTIDVNYEPITTCPPYQISESQGGRTFLGVEYCTSNKIGQNDDSILRKLCYDA